MNQTTSTPHPPDDEIDLIALAKTIWDGRKTIIIAILIGAVLGLCIALLSPKEYTATTTMVPQTNKGGSSLGNLGGLAAMAGINLGSVNAGENLSPSLYPQIIQSIPFHLELMKTPLNFEELPGAVSLFDYYTQYSKPTVWGAIKKYTLGLPGIILKSLRGEQNDSTTSQQKLIIQLSDDQKGIHESLNSSINLEANQKEGYLTLTVNMPEALAAAQLADKAQTLLQKSITEFKIEKAKVNLEFIQSRYNESKVNFEKAQLALAAFRDQNKNVTTALAKTEEERLSSEYQLTYSIYSELAKQLEQAKIQVKEDTPVFTIIEPVSVPQEKSKPKRSMILIIWIFLGGIVGVGWVFGKQFLKGIKERWNE